jgi:glycosyltransferase involved in cell wall biosynthesis
VRIAFVHFAGRVARLEAARAGDGPTEFLFGAVELERAGHQVSHHEVDPTRPAGPVARRLVDLQAGKGRLPPHASATVLRQTQALLPQLREADVVVATTTGTAVALATWRRAGRLRVPLVGIVAGLRNRPWSRARRATTLPLLRGMHAVLYGPGELDGLLRLDPQLADRVHVDRFGVDTRFWRPAERPSPAPVGVLAIGNDGSRDWPTLLRAAPALDAGVRILTSHPRPATLPLGVTWEAADWHRRLLSDAAVRDAYRGAAVVVVPVKDVEQPSGQSVTLQAMACGRPVILTRTRGLWDEELVNGDAVRLVPPGDSDALAEAIRELLGHPAESAALGTAARSWVERRAPVEGFAERLEQVCAAAVRAP